MTKRPLKMVAREMQTICEAKFQTRFYGLSFAPEKALGPTIDELGRTMLNIDAITAAILAFDAEDFTDRDVDGIFVYSADRERFMEWLVNFHRTFNKIEPNNPEQAALQRRDDQANAILYALLGATYPAR